MLILPHAADAGIPLRQSNAHIAALKVAADAAFGDNVRTRGLNASAPTVTVNGATRPSSAVVDYTLATQPGVWRQLGGTPTAIGGLQYIVSAHGIASNSSSAITQGVDDGVQKYQTSGWRMETVFTGQAITFQVRAYPLPYRFIVDGKYLNMTGSSPVATSGSAAQYITLSWPASGSHTVVIEGTGRAVPGLWNGWAGGCDGAWVQTGETCAQTPGTGLLRATMVGNSVPQGVGTLFSADACAQVMADYLGIRNLINSSIGGTEDISANGGTGLNFGQRVSDWTSGLDDALFFGPKYNDRTLADTSPATVAAEIAANIQRGRTSRADMPIFIFGAVNGNLDTSAANAGTWSPIFHYEKVIRDAVKALNDPLVRFVPLSIDPARHVTYSVSTVALSPHGDDAGNLTLGIQMAASVKTILDSLW